MEAPLKEIYRVKISTCVIPVYGTKEAPLFDATYIAYIFGMKSHRTTTRHFSNTECKVVWIHNNDRPHRVSVLSLDGLKRLVESRGVNKLTTAVLKWIALVEDASTVEIEGYDEQTPSELDEANQTIANLQSELYQSQFDNTSRDDEMVRLKRENEQLNHMIDQLQLSQREIDTKNTQLSMQLATTTTTYNSLIDELNAISRKSRVIEDITTRYKKI